jgi:hypothetical protein
LEEEVLFSVKIYQISFVQIANWAQGSSEPGLFTGSTGASILSEDQLQPSNPRFHAWAKKVD